MFATALPPSGIQSIRTLGDHAAPVHAAADALPVASAAASSSTSAAIAAVGDWSWPTWGLIIIGLGVLGVNLFAVLTKGTDAGAWLIQTFVAPVFAVLGLETLNTAKHILKTSGDGASATSDAIEAGLTGGSGAAAAGTGAAAGAGTGSADTKNVYLDISPRAAGAGAAASPVSGTSGWCFVGEDAGTRTCASVGAADTCMSGDVFPTQDVCVNPSLRA